ncbi:hypothetical protein [Streptomyces sp. NPDC056821]|uniref:hypothetical protein n=1 Tax=unclassified Streptomyces TaxID=2593676 RepID=UPI0036C24861
MTAPAPDGLPPEGPVTLAEAAGLPLVDFPPGWAVRHEVDRAFRAASLERTVTFELTAPLPEGRGFLAQAALPSCSG